LTIKKRLEVGKHNALSGHTASGRSGSSIWRRVLYPHSPLVRPCGTPCKEEYLWHALQGAVLVARLGGGVLLV